MTVFKGMHREIGNPVPGHQGIRDAIDPEGLLAAAAALREARDRARLVLAEAFEARERAGSVEQRMQAAIRAQNRRAL